MERLPYLYWFKNRKPSRKRKYTFHVYDRSAWIGHKIDKYGANFEIYIYANSVWEAKYNCQYWLIGQLKHITVSNERVLEFGCLNKLKKSYLKWKRKKN